MRALKLIFKAKDRYGDKVEVRQRDQTLDPGEVVIYINNGSGVILSARYVRKLRKALKRVGRG